MEIIALLGFLVVCLLIGLPQVLKPWLEVESLRLDNELKRRSLGADPTKKHPKRDHAKPIKKQKK